MRRRWLAGIFAVSAIWAILVAVFSSDHVHQLWGEIAAVGYAAVKAVAITRRRLLLWHAEAMEPTTA